MFVDLHSMYYQDRNYIIDGNDSETVNTFNNLGLRNSLGVSTCNGGLGVGSVGGIKCQNADLESAHKFNTGTDYIHFTAHTNLDVYLAYYETSKNASWISTLNFADTGSRIKTTVVGTPYYRLYKKTYLKGEDITLDGNLFGGGNSDTNYFLILRRAGDTSEGYPSNLCEAKPDIYPAVSISNPRGIPGKDKALLQWQNPTDENLSSIVIRQGKNSPPISMGDGDPPVGTPVNDHPFDLTGLVPNKTYYFSLFSLDKNGKWLRSTVSFTTGKDTDGDGLSDDYEMSQMTPWGMPSLNSGNPDTDGDGEDDRTEIINGTDPFRFNFFKPFVQSFSSTPYGTTQYPIITLNASAYDEKGVTGWMVTKTPTPPLGSDSRWISVGTPVQGGSTSPAITVNLPNLGTHTFYIWAKNAAGQVSNTYGPLTINYDGQKIPRFLYETNDRANTLGAYSIDLETGKLTNIQTIPYDSSNMPFGRGPLGIVVHPTSKYVYVTDGGSLFSYNADTTTGMLSPIDTKSFGNRINDPTDQLYMHPSGKSLYAFNSGSTMFRVYSIHPDGTAVFSTELVLGSYIYNFLNEPGYSYYKAIFASNFYDKISWNGGIYYPIDSYKNRIFFDPSGQFAELNYLVTIRKINPVNGSSYPIYPNVGYYDSIWTGPNSPYYNLGRLNFNYEGSIVNYDSGQDEFFSLLGGMFYPTDNFNRYKMGTFERSSGSAYSFTNTLTSATTTTGTYVGSGYLTDFYKVNRLFICKNSYNSFPIITQFFGGPSLKGCDNVIYKDFGFDITKIIMDPTNHFLYVPYREQSTGASRMINAFSINQQTGDLTPIDTDVTGTSSIFDVKVLDIHDYNDPPVVNIQQPAQKYVNLDTGGRIFLNGSYSYDPDYGRCGGNPANFVYKWELNYAPPGSQKTSADIVNSNTLSSAYFDADVTGQYGFKLSFTDDHGTCPGMNKTTIGYLDSISVRKIKKTKEMVYDKNPVFPGGGDKIQWIPTRREGGEQAGYVYEYGVMCGNAAPANWFNTSGTSGADVAASGLLMGVMAKYRTQEQVLQHIGFAAFASTFSGCTVLMICSSERSGLLSYQGARNDCNQALFGLEQWNPIPGEFTPVTEYGYWTYWGF